MADEDYSWLQAECEDKTRILEPGFEKRQLVDVGEWLYDPMMGWIDDQGVLTLCDIGGQPERGWDPTRGHGAMYRLYPDSRMERFVPYDKIGPGMPMSPRRAPAWFGDWEGTLFFPGQSKPGREGALSPHYVWRVEGDTAVPFSKLPHAGKIGGGVPGALCIGGFAPQGSRHEGYYICNTLMNCTIYVVDPQGNAEPWIILDGDDYPFPVSPYRVFWAGPNWGELEGEMIVAGLSQASFEEEAPPHNNVDFFVVEGDRINPKPLRNEDMGLSMAEIAPAQFGPFGGQVFYSHYGTVNLMHVTKPEPGPLPYTGKIFRIDENGDEHLFADNLQAGWNEILFDPRGNRMIVAYLRRSYSTGEYHEPDGSIQEIVYTG